MGSKIFINYRREDSPWNSLALYQELIKHFPKENIFKDFNTIRPGEDFVERIEKALESCSVLLVLISEHWLEAKDKNGKVKLSNEDDFVRLEIATALKRNIIVIPVLFDDAVLPHASDLPDDLKKLSRRQSIEIDKTRFEDDAMKLVNTIKNILAPPEPTPNPIPDPQPDLAANTDLSAKENNNNNNKNKNIPVGDTETPGLKKWYLPVLIAIAVAVILFFIFQNNNKSTTGSNHPVDSPLVQNNQLNETGKDTTSLGSSVSKELSSAPSTKKDLSKKSADPERPASHVIYNSFPDAFYAAFEDAKNNFVNIRGKKINDFQPAYFTKIELHDRTFNGGVFDANDISETDNEWVFRFTNQGDKNREEEGYLKIDHLIIDLFKSKDLKFEKEKYAPREDMGQSFRYNAPPYRIEVLRMIPSPGTYSSTEIIIYHSKNSK
jgi:hypothetical protein